MDLTSQADVAYLAPIKELYWSGVAVEDIAAELNLTVDQVMDALTPVVNAPRTRDQLRLREHQRLEWQHQQIMSRLQKDVTDDDAHELSMKLSKEKARLLGLNAPLQVESRSQVQIVIRYSHPEFGNFGRNEKGEIEMSSDRLAYQRGEVIEAEAVEQAVEVVEAKPVPTPAPAVAKAIEAPAVPWKEPDPTSVAAAVASKPTPPMRPQPPTWRRKY